MEQRHGCRSDGKPILNQYIFHQRVDILWECLLCVKLSSSSTVNLLPKSVESLIPLIPLRTSRLRFRNGSAKMTIADSVSLEQNPLDTRNPITCSKMKYPRFQTRAFLELFVGKI